LPAILTCSNKEVKLKQVDIEYQSKEKDIFK